MEKRVEIMGVAAMPEWMRDLVEGVSTQLDHSPLTEVRKILGSSNDTLELSFGDDRVLMVKRGRHDWTRRMFRTAAAASELLRGSTDLAAPHPLPLDLDSAEPLQAYWRIALPTLGELWPALDAAERVDALRSLGRLLRRTHQVRATGWGDLLEPRRGARGLQDYLNHDLGGRLLPAVYAIWSDGLAPLERLIEAIPAVTGRVAPDEPVLSHSDVHIQNVVCRRTDGAVRCVGLLDLDNARALPPEADVASFQVLHGPLFNQRLEENELDAMLDGYGDPLDPLILGFFRAAHLCNLGFHSALVGDDLHAGWVAHAFHAEVDSVYQTLGRQEVEEVAGILP